MGSGSACTERTVTSRSCPSRASPTGCRAARGRSARRRWRPGRKRGRLHVAGHGPGADAGAHRGGPGGGAAGGAAPAPGGGAPAGGEHVLPAAPGGAGGAIQGADGALGGGGRGFQRLRYIRQPEWGIRRDALGVHALGRVEYEVRDGEVVYKDGGPVRVMVTERQVGPTGEPTLRDVSE